MSRYFDQASNESMRASSTPITGTPCTLAIFAQADSEPSDNIIFGVGVDAGSTGQHCLELWRDISHDRLAMARCDSSADLTYGSNNTFNLDVWTHCCMVCTADNNADLFTDGGDKTNDTTSKTPSGIDSVSVGRYSSGSSTSGRSRTSKRAAQRPEPCARLGILDPARAGHRDRASRADPAGGGVHAHRAGDHPLGVRAIELALVGVARHRPRGWNDCGDRAQSPARDAIHHPARRLLPRHDPHLPGPRARWPVSPVAMRLPSRSAPLQRAIRGPPARPKRSDCSMGESRRSPAARASGHPEAGTACARRSARRHRQRAQCLQRCYRTRSRWRQSPNTSLDMMLR